MRKEEIKKLLERSKKFKDAADFHFSREDFDLAVFNLEQSLQLFLKGKLLEKGMEFPKAHTLRKLFSLLGECLESSEEFKEFISKNSLEFASLEDAYITARYFLRDFEKAESERLRAFVEEVETFVRKYSN
ncbi:MAG: HEPN domain-containing protein [Nitrososphaeria archaeon]